MIIRTDKDCLWGYTHEKLLQTPISQFPKKLNIVTYIYNPCTQKLKYLDHKLDAPQVQGQPQIYSETLY